MKKTNFVIGCFLIGSYVFASQPSYSMNSYSMNRDEASSRRLKALLEQGDEGQDHLVGYNTEILAAQGLFDSPVNSPRGQIPNNVEIERLQAQPIRLQQQNLPVQQNVYTTDGDEVPYERQILLTLRNYFNAYREGIQFTGNIEYHNRRYWYEKPMAELLINSGIQEYINIALAGFFWNNLKLYRETDIGENNFGNLNLLVGTTIEGKERANNWRDVVCDMYNTLINRGNLADEPVEIITSRVVKSLQSRAMPDRTNIFVDFRNEIQQDLTKRGAALSDLVQFVNTLHENKKDYTPEIRLQYYSRFLMIIRDQNNIPKNSIIDLYDKISSDVFSIRENAICTNDNCEKSGRIIDEYFPDGWREGI